MNRFRRMIASGLACALVVSGAPTGALAQVLGAAAAGEAGAEAAPAQLNADVMAASAPRVLPMAGLMKTDSPLNPPSPVHVDS
ncbi:MAG: hypothetical protein ACHQ2Z_08790, partial [Elusimicrobiota bacterium]